MNYIALIVSVVGMLIEKHFWKLMALILASALAVLLMRLPELLVALK